MKIVLKNRKVILFIVTLQEAFSAIIPFFLLSSFFSLFYFFIKYYHIDFFFINSSYAELLMYRLNSTTSIVANISIAYFFASRIKVSQIVASSLAVATFITILFYENPTEAIILPYGFSAATLWNPIVSTCLLKLFYPKFSLKISIADGNHHIYRHFNYLFVFIFAYFFTIGLYIFTDFFLDKLLIYTNNIHLNLPNIILMSIRNFFIQISWFFGLHGSHIVNAIMGKNILSVEMFPNLTYAEFNRLFVTMGGGGVGIGLLLSLLLHTKDRSIKFITKLSIPFVTFNINTLLIYAVVVLNRYMLFPFIFLPILNLLVAFGTLHCIDIHFTDYYLTWTTPIFVDAFLKTVEYQKIILLQSFLLALDTAVYIYFIKKFTNSQSPTTHFDLLLKNLDIADEIRAQENLVSFVKRQEIIEANAELDKIIDIISNNSLYIYYQPKVSTKTGECNQFEALIRYYNNGKLIGPIFLDTIERAGLAPVIDIYVCKKVKEDLKKWSQNNFFPEIGINLHPDTLKNSDAITKIIEIQRNQNILFEIIERSFLERDSIRNLLKLQQNRFKIAIDDFGTGYSSFETLVDHKIDELKMDKSLIDTIQTKKGYLVCKNIVNLCHELGSCVVSEGVETKEQLDILEKIGADLIQGYFFSSAIPFNRVEDFAKSNLRTTPPV